MKTEEIIRNALKFLEKDYNFKYTYKYERGNHYYYKNIFGVFEYFEWKQFNEEKFFATYNNESKIIDMFLENPKKIGNFVYNNKKIEILFSDRRMEYWNLIASIIKNEIENTNTLFGIPINRA